MALTKPLQVWRVEISRTSTGRVCHSAYYHSQRQLARGVIHLTDKYTRGAYPNTYTMHIYKTTLMQWKLLERNVL